MQLKKIMLVCSEPSNEVEEHLLVAGCWVTKTKNGRAAALWAKREDFDAALLISTGKDMDLAETALTLRDVSPSLQIIILDQEVPEESGLPRRSIAEVIPNTKALTVGELKDYLLLPERRTGLEPAKEQKTSHRGKEN